METIVLPANHPQALECALQVLQSGDLVAFPTDTVYGLGASLLDMPGIARLYQVKARDLAKAIPVLVGDLAGLAEVAPDAGPVARSLATRFWPGPLTLVVPKRVGLPEILSAEPTIGVRMPDHPVTLALLRAIGPLAVTSANLSGAANALTAEDVFAQLAGRIPLILDGGRAPGGSPSTVVDCSGADLVILRQGPITLDELKQALA